MPEEPQKIRIGISTCLLGENVRFDGGHKRDQYITNTLDAYFQWIPVCPEVEIGMGTPRESLRLVGDPQAPRLLTTKSGKDYTGQMQDYSRQKIEALRGLGLDGYVLKRASPSCGMERVKVYDQNAVPAKSGVGIFARELLDAFLLLPIEEEGRLNDPRIRENFIIRVFCHHRWRQATQERFSTADLVDFHTRHKFLLMAHNEQAMRELGRLVAGAASMPAETLKADYERGFFTALRSRATARKHTNVLQHIMGYFKKQLEPRDKEELLALIEDYRRGLLPLIVPITLIKHYVSKFQVAYILDQVYLNPHPKELALLNHV